MDAKARIHAAADGFWDAPLGGSFRELDKGSGHVTASGYNDTVERRNGEPALRTGEEMR